MHDIQALRNLTLQKALGYLAGAETYGQVPGTKLDLCPRKARFARFPKRDTRIGLVSFPGSGNTWLRHILQQLTGRGLEGGGVI